MDTQKLLELALQPTVLVALIYTIGALVGGRWLIRSKDEQLKSKEQQIKTKDEQITTLKEAHAAQLQVKDDHIAYLKQWMPVSGVEQLEAVQTLFKMQLDSAQQKINLLTNQNTSEQEKRQQLEVEYRDQIHTLTERLETANKIEMELKTMAVPGALIDLSWSRLHTAIHATSPVDEGWDQFIKQYQLTSTVFQAKDAPTDKDTNSDSQEPDDN